MFAYAYLWFILPQSGEGALVEFLALLGDNELKFMRNRRLWGLGVLVLFLALIPLGLNYGASTVLAIDSSSRNYQVTEWEFGSGATIDGCSGSYCSQATIGDQGAASSGTSPQFGTVKTDEPLLEVIIEPGESNLGTLSTERTATKTTSVKVRNNYDGGYSLQMVGDPPKLKNHTLATPSTPTASIMGQEQFAINLVANTAPSVGAAPIQVALQDGQQSIFGEPTETYKTPNRFMYQSGDIIAKSVTEKGRTDYTISMIVNISSSTPAGKYTGDFSLYIVPAL